LRREDPELYDSILAQATGEAAQGAARDPDAFVALFLAEAADAGVIGDGAAEAPAELPPVDLDYLTEIVRSELLSLSPDDTLRTFPKWAIDRYVKVLVLHKLVDLGVLDLGDGSFLNYVYAGLTDRDSGVEHDLDRVIEETGLGPVVESIGREVLITPAQYEEGRRPGDSADPRTWETDIDELAASVGMDREEWESLSEEERAELLESAEEERQFVAERRAKAAVLEHDPGYHEYLDALVDRVNALWSGDDNPLKRDSSGQPSDVERAIIKQATTTAAMPHAFQAAEEGGEIDRARYDRDSNVAIFATAAGYLWRKAELEHLEPADCPPFSSIRSAAEFSTENPSPEGFGDSTAGLMAKAVSFAVGVDADGSLGFAVLARDPYEGIALEDGCARVIDFACDLEGVQPEEMLLDETGLRRAFISGVALCEIEPLFAGRAR
jgi:hypothetical protein